MTTRPGCEADPEQAAEDIVVASHEPGVAADGSPVQRSEQRLLGRGRPDYSLDSR
ncbi:MAG: hypothetical protein KJT03_11920 [Verrucomicrobiae bacterium]|nr:hypothetical protein [Verrucomicrobiae bacterium]